MTVGTPTLWAITLAAVLGLIAVDFLLTRRPHEVSMREAALFLAFRSSDSGTPAPVAAATVVQTVAVTQPSAPATTPAAASLPVVTAAAPEDVADLLDAVVGPDTLVIASTDLSHHLPDAEARRPITSCRRFSRLSRIDEKPWARTSLGMSARTLQAPA